MLSKEKLLEIQTRVNKATEGPWVLEPITGKYYYTVILFSHTPEQGSISLVSPPSGTLSPREEDPNPEELTHHEDISTYNDAQFIVHAREDIAVLLKHISEQEAIISKLKKEMPHGD